MVRVTYYAVQPFVRGTEGDLIGREAMEAPRI